MTFDSFIDLTALFLNVELVSKDTESAIVRLRLRIKVSKEYNYDKTLGYTNTHGTSEKTKNPTQLK